MASRRHDGGTSPEVAAMQRSSVRRRTHREIAGRPIVPVSRVRAVDRIRLRIAEAHNNGIGEEPATSANSRQFLGAIIGEYPGRLGMAKMSARNERGSPRLSLANTTSRSPTCRSPTAP